MIIYIATRRETGMSYIGKTTKSLAKRKSDHRYEAFKRQHKNAFHTALRTHGMEAFDWKIIAQPTSNLKKYEQYWIRFYNTVNNGYNTQYR
jgi:hypothetical protein